MTDFFISMSSWLSKVKARFGTHPELIESKPLDEKKKQRTSPALLTEDQLSQMNDFELHGFFREQPERTVVRYLQSLKDQKLQLKIVQGISNEAMLKRLSHSNLDKKLKRAAEKKLRDTGSSAEKTKLAQIDKLSVQLENFLRNPRWQDARELLDAALDLEFASSALDPTSASLVRFQAAKEHLQSEILKYEDAVTALEDICHQLDPSLDKPLSKGAVNQLQARWNKLLERYAFPRELDILRRYQEYNESRKNIQPAKPAVVSAAAIKVEKSPLEVIMPPPHDQDRNHRLQTMETVLTTLRDFNQTMNLHQARTLLKKQQNELAALRRWKREFGPQWEEAETLLINLLSKNAEALQDAQWSVWARTDRASRIQAELETWIANIEADLDPRSALKKFQGLPEKLLAYSSEMRGMGRLDREKDQEIWSQFKSLSARGLLVCDRMKLQIFEELKMILADHLSHQNELNLEALAGTSATIGYKASAFSDDVSAGLRHLRSLWREIGGQGSEATREVETALTRAFEIYFRQLNLHIGRLRREETQALQKRQDMLAEMKAVCEGKSTLLSRVMAGKNLEQKWKSAPRSEAMPSELQLQFEIYQGELNSQVITETEKLLSEAANLQAQTQGTLDRILAKDGANLSELLKSVSSIEVRLGIIEKELTQLKKFSSIEDREKLFSEIRDRMKVLTNNISKAASDEVSERTQRRNQVISEAQELALSHDWPLSQARFEELKSAWKNVRSLGRKDDRLFDLLFENIHRFYASRLEAREKQISDEKKIENLKARKELLYSLATLSRFIESKNANSSQLSLPMTDEDRAKAPVKMLEIGLKYKKILALDPEDGITKETKKIMAEWSSLGSPDDEFIAGFWNYYLNRVQALLGITVG